MNINSTKLSAFCDSVIEVGWLAAVIVTPLFFNVCSSRTFDPDKLTILRTIALAMAAVWMVKLVEERASGDGGVGFTWRTPLVLPTLFMVGIYLISTALSLTPRASLFGSYGRLQGTCTTFSYILVFLMILQGMRTRAQLDRLVTAIIVNSLPIALYGLIQRIGLDPLPWGQSFDGRVFGNMGNPIFLAAYLIMVFPLTLGRVLEGLAPILTEKRGNWANIMRAVGYTFIAAVQLIAIWYTQSRGPLFALVAGSYLFFLLLALAWHHKWGAITVVAVVALTALAVGFLVFVSVAPGGLPHSLQRVPWLGRLGEVFEFGRVLIWQGMVNLILPHEPLQYPDGHSDPFNLIRPLVGYGPESIRVAYYRFRPSLHWPLESGAVGRAHNETFDALATTGLLGLIAYLFLFLSVFYYGLKWLGVLGRKEQRLQFLGLILGCALVGVVFSWWQVGPHFFGVALTAGIAAGLAIYLVTVALVFAIRMLTSGESTLPPLHTHHVLILSLLAAIVSHFIEINFGVAVASTRATFWAYAGLLVVAGLNLIRERSEEPAPETGARANQRASESASQRTPKRTLPGWLWPTLGNAVVGGFILGTLAFNFAINFVGLSDAGRIIWCAPAILPTQGGRTSCGVLMIVVPTWLTAGVIFLSEMGRRGAFKRRVSDWLPASLLYLTVSLGLGFAFALLLAGHMAALPDARLETGAIEDVLLLAGSLASRMTFYYGFVAFVLLAGGLVLLGERTPPKMSATAWGLAASIPLLVLAGYLAVRYNLIPVQADIIYKQGLLHDKERKWDVAIAHYEHAVELVPYEDWYYYQLSHAYLKQGVSTSDPAQQSRLFQVAEQSLVRAREINPLETDHTVGLARMYSLWWALASDPAQKERLGQDSVANYEIATESSPYNAILWNEKGDVSLQLGRLEEAAEAYEHVVELSSRSTQVWHNLGFIYAQLGRIEDAITATEKALELAPEAEDAWNAHWTLVALYSGLGRLNDALLHAQMAWQLAPEKQKPALEDLIAQLEEAMEAPEQ